MATIRIDTTKTVRPMKPMHGGGQPPLLGANVQHFHYLTEAGIPYSRLHDVGGAFGQGKFVDIPNIFRNFEADVNDPASYDFAFTDHLITALVQAGVEPYFRLGITIENYAGIKAYHTAPPADYDKWARICEHIVRHYTEGWANGFCYQITYWEIWNEPDNRDTGHPSVMWEGTPEEFYRLYDVTAKHLKACFPHIKVGGYGGCGFYGAVPPTGAASYTPTKAEQFFIDFFHGFFAYIREHETPIDFFSWHSYADTARTLGMDAYVHDELTRMGFGELETHMNEWNPFPGEFGTAHHAAEVTAMMLGMQNAHTDLLCIYDMRTNTAPYCPLFDIRTHKPIHGYYAMVAFNTLYRLGHQVELTCDTDRLYAVAASDGPRHAVVLSNLTGQTQSLTIEGVDLSNARFYILDQERLLSWAPHALRIAPNTVMLIEW